MTIFVLYLLLVGAIVYFIAKGTRPGGAPTGKTLTSGALRKAQGPRNGPCEIWKQVYETASMDEARSIQVRLGEEGIDCILYEQGKKDIHGNLLAGVGIAVPSGDVSRAQATIAKMPA